MAQLREPLRPTNEYHGDLFSGVLTPPAWMADALCAQTDPEEFYPDKGGSTRAAKAICARCPVAAECLEFALAHGERFGIWGNTSERERRLLLDTLDQTKEAS